jgi:hypothetical protein
LFGGALSNAQLWEDYFLVLETLEEKAPHLIQQILSRVTALASDSGASGGHPLHLSWLLIIFTRFFQHQNTIVIRQGLEAFLTTTGGVGCEKGREEEEGEMQLLADFLVKRLFDVLNESRIYSVLDEDGGSNSSQKVHLGETIRCVVC